MKREVLTTIYAIKKKKVALPSRFKVFIYVTARSLADRRTVAQSSFHILWLNILQDYSLVKQSRLWASCKFTRPKHTARQISWDECTKHQQKTIFIATSCSVNNTPKIQSKWTAVINVHGKLPNCNKLAALEGKIITTK